MKNIYFVRHGESLSNSGQEGVGRDSRLTKKGVEQAEFVATRCAKLPIERIISSTMIRAKETAEIINAKTNKPIEFLDIFAERRGPSIYSGVSEKEWNEIRKNIKGYFYTPGFKHSDEENFDDILVRVNKCLEYLKSKEENNLLVIAHGSFLRDLISLAIFKENLTPALRRSMTKGFTTVNTGITVLTYDDVSNQWSLLTWNDHAHLG